MRIVDDYNPLKNISLDHIAGVGHHIPLTGCLSSIHSGRQGDGGCIIIIEWGKQLHAW